MGGWGEQFRGEFRMVTLHASVESFSFRRFSTRTEGHGPAGQLPTESEEIGVAHDPSEGGGHLLAGDKRSVPRRWSRSTPYVRKQAG